MGLSEELLKVDKEKLSRIAQAVVRRNFTVRHITENPLNSGWRERNPTFVALSEAVVESFIDIAESFSDEDEVVTDIEGFTAGMNLALYILSEYCEVVETELAFPDLALDE